MVPDTCMLVRCRRRRSRHEGTGTTDRSYLKLHEDSAHAPHPCIVLDVGLEVHRSLGEHHERTEESQPDGHAGRAAVVLGCTHGILRFRRLCMHVKAHMCFGSEVQLPYMAALAAIRVHGTAQAPLGVCEHAVGLSSSGETRQQGRAP